MRNNLTKADPFVSAPREKRGAIFGKVRENGTFKGVVSAKVEKYGRLRRRGRSRKTKKPRFLRVNVVEVDCLAFRYAGDGQSRLPPARLLTCQHLHAEEVTMLLPFQGTNGRTMRVEVCRPFFFVER
jgi:hypothetical protein